MADPEIFIVSRLNDCFGLDLTLVDFDEKAPLELLQLLLDVLADLDPRLRGDVRDAGTAESAGRAADLLRLLKYPPLRDRADADGYQKWVDAAAAGATTTVHPALHWLLGDVERHRTRAYVARFLAPVDVPPHLLDDAALREAFEHHRALQRDFRDAHRAVVARAARRAATAARSARRRVAEAGAAARAVAAPAGAAPTCPTRPAPAATRACGWRRTRTRGPRDGRAQREAARRRGRAGPARGAARAPARRGRRGAHGGRAHRRRAARRARRRAPGRRGGGGAAPRRRRRGARTRRSSSGAWATSRRAAELRARCRDACEARGDATLRSFRATAQIVARRLAEKSAAVDGLEVDLEAAASARSRPRGARPRRGRGRRRAGRAALRRRPRRTTRDYKAKQERLRRCAASCVAHRTERVLRAARATWTGSWTGSRGAGRAWLPGRARALAAAAGRQEASDAAKAGELEAAAAARARPRALRARKAELAPRIAAPRGAPVLRARGGPPETKRARRRRRGGRRGRRAAPRARGGRAPGGRARRERAHYPNCRPGAARGRRPRAREDARRAAPAAAPRLLPDFAGYAGSTRTRATASARRRPAPAEEGRLDRGAGRAAASARARATSVALAARLAARGARAPDAAAAEYLPGHARRAACVAGGRRPPPPPPPPVAPLTPSPAPRRVGVNGGSAWAAKKGINSSRATCPEGSSP